MQTKSMINNGFTLIELLATIVIMGMIITMITPSIVNLQNNNKKKKFEYYGKTLVEAAKFYIQREGDDITNLGVSDWIGCVEITYQDLLQNDLIKQFDDKDYDCTGSKVRLTRTKNTNVYDYNLVCNSKNSKKDSYSSINIANNQCNVTKP